MNKIIYLFSGKAQAGKDYTSNLLKEALENSGKTVKKLSFASKLKEYLSVLLDVTLDDLERFKLEEKPFTANGLTVRQLMQRMGTELFRKHFGYDFWVSQTGKTIAETSYEYYIISDYRFPNEYNVIDYAREFSDDTYEIYTVRVINDNIIKSSDHISENLLDDLKHDIIIDNRGHSYKFNIKDFKGV